VDWSLSSSHRVPEKIIVQELSQQLSDWRSHLPAAIAWNDDQSVETMEDTYMSDFNQATGKQSGPDPGLTEVICFRAVLNAALRTRYKYAEFLIWRSYIYRALHVPGDLTIYDYECCSKAFKVSRSGRSKT
jgi:hypothetical protein